MRKLNWLYLILLLAVILVAAGLYLAPPQLQTFAVPHTVITSANAHQVKFIGRLHTSWPETIQFSDDSSIIMIGDEDGVFLFKNGIESLHIKETAACDGDVCKRPFFGGKSFLPDSYRTALSPDGNYVALAINRGDLHDLRVWSIAAGKIVKSFGINKGLKALAFDPKSLFLIYSDQTSDNTKIMGWDIQTDAIISIDEFNTPSDNPYSLQVEFMKTTGELIYTHDSLDIYNLSKREKRSVVNKVNFPPGLAINPYLGQVAVMYEFNGGTIWDYRTGADVSGYLHDDIGTTMRKIAYNPDGGIFASADWAKVYLWDTVTNAILHILDSPNQDFAFSPNGELIAVLDMYGREIQLWDVKTGSLLATLKADNYWIASHLAFSPDGTMIISDDGKVWGVV